MRTRTINLSLAALWAVGVVGGAVLTVVAALDHPKNDWNVTVFLADKPSASQRSEVETGLQHRGARGIMYHEFYDALGAIRDQVQPTEGVPDVRGPAYRATLRETFDGIARIDRELERLDGVTEATASPLGDPEDVVPRSRFVAWRNVWWLVAFLVLVPLTIVAGVVRGRRSTAALEPSPPEER